MPPFAFRDGADRKCEDHIRCGGAGVEVRLRQRTRQARELDHQRTGPRPLVAPPVIPILGGKCRHFASQEAAAMPFLHGFRRIIFEYQPLVDAILGSLGIQDPERQESLDR